MKNNYNGLLQQDIKVNSCKVNFFAMNKGESIVSQGEIMRLCAVVSGEFSFNSNRKNSNSKEWLDRDKTFVFFAKEPEFVCEEDNSELVIVEFEAEIGIREQLFGTDFNGIFAKLNTADRQLFKMFFAEAKLLGDSSAELNYWVALLLIKIRSEYLRSYKNTLENHNGAIFFGVAPQCDGEFELAVTDAFLVITDNQSGEKRAIKFSCEYRFLERSHYSHCETESFKGNKNLKYAKLSTPPERFFKLWLFPENEKIPLDVSPFTHSLKFSFSLKANTPCKVNTGISNITDYEMVNRVVEIDAINKWNDYLLTLYGADLPEKANRYVKETVRYIDENFSQKITVSQLAKDVHLNPNYLSRIFRQYMGCSISQYVNNKRISEAKRLLNKTDETVEAIAIRTGFYDSHHLQKCFKHRVGYSPAEHRKNRSRGIDG